MPRAVRFDHYGDTDVLDLVEVDQPQPKDGEVVVEVITSGINPGENSIRSGALEQMYPTTFPCGQGSDFAGRIHAIGAGVHGWQVGEDVLGWTDDRAAQADFVVVPGEHLTTRPADVPWDQAGSLPIAGFTAYAAVRAIAPLEGETVVVFGAAGGVGSIAVQLLKRLDVRVIGVAGKSNAEWLTSIGVEPVEYGTGLGHRLRELVADGIDAAIDTFGDGYVDLAIGLGVPAHRINTIIDFAAAEKFGTKSDGGGAGAASGVLAELTDMITAGQLTVPIAATFPLEQVREAYTQLAERHTRGKIVLEVGAA